MTKTIISRSEARSAGLKVYFTGKPCPHGHVAHRRVSNTVCIECANGSAQQRAAQQAGWMFYNTGRPCKYGHIADRYASNGGCVECLRISDLAQNARISAERWATRIARTPVPTEIAILYSGTAISREHRVSLDTLSNDWYLAARVWSVTAFVRMRHIAAIQRHIANGAKHID